jgi:guanylate kinase
VAKRMAEAEAEISHAGEFDHVLVNDDFDVTLAGLTAILHAARSATHRQTGLAALLARMA